MPEDKPVKDEVAKSKSRMIGALVALLLVAVVAGVFALTGGIDKVGDLIAGTSDAEEPADQPADEPAEEPAEESAEETPGVTSDGVEPTIDQQNLMYAEQVWSQEQIRNLVADKIASFMLEDVTTSGSTASVRVTAAYRSGPDVSGTMVLRDFGGTWYFQSITRDGHEAITPSVKGDSGVLAAIMTAQRDNQDIPKAIVDGSYTTLSVDGVTQGSGTASIEISLAGAAVPPATGTITCISKDIGGVTHWFITSFSRD
jgi:hypothetical protein